VQQASKLKNVQNKFGCEHAALGSLSEAATVFDPEPLVEIIQELNGQRTPTHGGKDPRLANLPGRLTLVDATLISAMPRIMTASVIPKKSKPTSRNSNSTTPSPRKKSDLTAALGCAPRNQSPLTLRVIQTAHTLPMLPNFLAQGSTNPTRHPVESEMTKIENQARREIGVPNGIGCVPFAFPKKSSTYPAWALSRRRASASFFLAKFSVDRSASRSAPIRSMVDAEVQMPLEKTLRRFFSATTQ